MAIQLDGIDLPDLVIENEFSWSGVEAKVDRTLGGTLLIWEQTVTGRPIILIGGADFGWLTRDQLIALQAIASVPGATYVLDYEGIQYNVRFMHESGDPITATPIIPRPNHSGADYYANVILRLMEV